MPTPRVLTERELNRAVLARQLLLERTALPIPRALETAELAGVTSPAAPGGELEDFRISIAGAQEKTAFLRHQGKWCRPIGSTPTTHIFKLPLGLVGNRQAV